MHHLSLKPPQAEIIFNITEEQDRETKTRTPNKHFILTKAAPRPQCPEPSSQPSPTQTGDTDIHGALLTVLLDTLEPEQGLMRLHYSRSGAFN